LPGRAGEKIRADDAGRIHQGLNADTGHGIPPEIQDKIFDPFFTTRKADKQRGSGLGLSVYAASSRITRALST